LNNELLKNPPSLDINGATFPIQGKLERVPDYDPVGLDPVVFFFECWFSQADHRGAADDLPPGASAAATVMVFEIDGDCVSLS